MSDRELPPIRSDGGRFEAGRQLSLPLDAREPDLRLIVTPANADAVSLIERPDRWSGRSLILTGPRKSGRSLHARLAAAHGARVLDDADRRCEEEVFRAWNAAQDDGPPLLLVADRPPPDWRPRLADLRSRLGGSSIATLADPDATMADSLLEKLLLARGLMSTAGLRAEALTRLERSHLAIVRFADALPPARALTRTMIRALARPVESLAA